MNLPMQKKNPYAANLKDGYSIIIEHKEYDEIIEVKKTKHKKQPLANTNKT